MSEMFISRNITALNFYNGREDTKIAAAVVKIIIRFEAIRWDDRERRLCSVAIIKRHRKREYAWNNFHLSHSSELSTMSSSSSTKEGVNRQQTATRCCCWGPFMKIEKSTLLGEKTKTSRSRQLNIKCMRDRIRSDEREWEVCRRWRRKIYRNPQHFHSIYSTARYANLGRRSCGITFSLSASLGRQQVYISQPFL